MKLKTKTLFAALAVLFMAVSVGTAFGEQPDKWVRYVEATGSQYVDTGVQARWGTKAEMKVEWLDVPSLERIQTVQREVTEQNLLSFPLDLP